MVSVPQLGSLHLFSIPDNGLSWEDCVAVNNDGCLSLLRQGLSMQPRLA